MTLGLNCKIHMGIVGPTLCESFMAYTSLHYNISSDVV